jgi:hypothetical protein
VCSRVILVVTAAKPPAQRLRSTLTFLVSDVLKLPSCEEPEGATAVVENAITLARADWNDRETSWDFRDQPLLRTPVKGGSLEMSWKNWEAQSAGAVHRLRELETASNRLFIAAYGLGDELRAEVPEAQITLFRNPANRYKKSAKKRKITDEDPREAGGPDCSEEELCYPAEQRSAMFREDTIKEFLSYAVGCMLGRYSLEKPGLILASTGDTVERYWELVGREQSAVGAEGGEPPQCSAAAANQSPMAPLSMTFGQLLTAHRPLPALFPPDADGIIPVTELAWFPDDAAERVVEFLTKTFSQEALAANLKFMAEALSPTKDEAPRDTIRRYLASGFYKDHLQTYKRRPIYWLFSSGKQRAFQCLVYLHRYNEGTLARMRTEYVIPLQGKISNRIDQLAGDIPAATSTSHRKKLEKERETLVKQASELAAFDEKLRHYADQRIALDLDDGVKVNYGKFGDLLAEVKAVTGGAED